MEFSEILRRLRLKAHLTQESLGNKVGVSVVTVRNWESGTKLPSASAIISLSKILGVSSDELLGIKPSNIDVLDPYTLAESKLLRDYRELDSFGKKAVEQICSTELKRIKQDTSEKPERFIRKFITPSAAGNSCPLDDAEYEMMLVDDTVPANADFAVVIQGSSMEPYISDGDTVFVKKQSSLQNGEVGIFNVDGAMYCKIFYKTPNGDVILLSSNPYYMDSNVFLNDDSNSSITCYGKCIIRTRVRIPEYFKHMGI